MEELYNLEFYKRQSEGSYDSAKKTLSLFFKYYQPDSVIDIGCGVGTWLKAWQDLGIKNIRGVDCNKIEQEFLYVPRDVIKIDNLETHKNINNEKYDLAMSLEVAEHLSKDSSEDFVKLLTSYSDVIIFSAALPHQHGVNHINCQPPKFWVDIFRKYDYKCFDILRRDLLSVSGDAIACYAQNILVFVKKDKKHIFNDIGFTETDNPVFYYHPAYVQAIIDGSHTMLKKNLKYKILSKFAFGKMRSRYKQKYEDLKRSLGISCD